MSKKCVRSWLMGHEIFYDQSTRCWRYKDGLDPIKRLLKPCIKCNKTRTKEGHDPCIADLPGVRNACCGHGTNEGYIQFNNG